MGSIYKRGKIWHIQYYQNGRPIRETTKTSSKVEARKLLALRETQVLKGELPEIHRKVTLFELFQDLETEYTNNQRKSMERLKIAEKHILDHFGSTTLAKSLNGSHIQGYIKARMEKKISGPTVNRELGCISRCFHLGKQNGKISQIPFIPKLKENPPRKGFIEQADYEKLKREIGDDLKILLGLGYHHGLRKGEILNLRWNDVDFFENKITFEGEKTIKGETREVYLHSELIQLINAEYAYRNIHYPSSPWVCSRYGKKITYFAKSWKRACKKVGLDNLIFHDLRRSSIRNMIRSGISQTVAMKISGHRTPSIFRRYDITSGEDLKQATKKLEIYQNSLNGHKNATIPVEEGKSQAELLETIN